jgi:hypothetical protein
MLIFAATLEASPKPEERIIVYRLVSLDGWVHVKARTGGGMFSSATYQLHEPQPADDDVRDTAKWRSWALLQPAPIVKRPKEG